jgi:hypothetical protein
MRYFVLAGLLACGGGKKAVESPKPSEAKPVAASSACVTAYAEYEKRWREARSEELAAIDFDAPSIDEVISIEVALLPTKSDLAKLRGQYVVVDAFIPDSAWPVALNAADAAIEQCGEEAPRPV